MESLTNKLGDWAEGEARKRGLLDDFIYLNYANGEQQVYQRSVTREDLDRLQQVKMLYDPFGTLNKLWKGGFKLPERSVDGVEGKDEL